MKVNIKFLEDHIRDAVWEIVFNVERKAGSRAKAYLEVIGHIGIRDAEQLDASSEVKGDALYLAAGICGEKFWDLFIDQVKRCIEIDFSDGDLKEFHVKSLLPFLELASTPLPGTDRK